MPLLHGVRVLPQGRKKSAHCHANGRHRQRGCEHRFWHTNPDNEVADFFDKSAVPPLRYVEIPPQQFLDITRGSMPLIAFVDNGKAVECHKYMELNETQMKNFLSHK